MHLFPSDAGLREFAKTLGARTLRPGKCSETRFDPQRRPARNKAPPSVAALRQFAKALPERKPIQDYFRDRIGNAISIKSTGHIHHPINMHAGKCAMAWASLVHKKLDSYDMGINGTIVSGGEWLDVTEEIQESRQQLQSLLTRNG